MKNPCSRKIIFAWNYLEWGGVQIYFIGISRFINRKYQVKAILPKKSDGKILDYLKANSIEFDVFDNQRESVQSTDSFGKIKRRVKNFFCNISLARQLAKEDLSNSVVQIDAAPWDSFCLLFYISLKTRVFLTFHTALPTLSANRRWLWILKFRALGILQNLHFAASNEEVRRSLRSFISEKRFAQMKVAYSGINTSEIEQVLENAPSRREIADRYGFPIDKFWLCNVGQFIERKGCWILLESLRILQSRNENFFCYWLGTAALNDDLQKKIAEYELEKSFRFLSAEEIGPKRSDMLNALNAADLFVMPSLEEGLPLSLLEAMALQKTCLTSDVNAVPEAITHLDNGFLLARNDPENLAEAILNLKNNNSLRNNLGRQAGKTVLEKFNEAKTGQTMLELYDNSFKANKVKNGDGIKRIVRDK